METNEQSQVKLAFLKANGFMLPGGTEPEFTRDGDDYLVTFTTKEPAREITQRWRVIDGQSCLMPNE